MTPAGFRAPKEGLVVTHFLVVAGIEAGQSTGLPG
jgi:hypothetical protein